MEQSKIDRINFLARKSRESGLTEDEKKEQQKLRAEYVAAFRKKRSRQHKHLPSQQRLPRTEQALL